MCPVSNLVVCDNYAIPSLAMQPAIRGFLRDLPETQYMKKRVRDVVLALCMGQHPRLGASSWLYVLEPQVVQRIAEELVDLHVDAFRKLLLSA